MFSFHRLWLCMARADVDLASFTSSQGYKILGAANSDWAGQSVSAGDVDGDNRTEVIVGVPYADPLGRGSAGAVYVTKGAFTGNRWGRADERGRWG